MPMPRRGLRRVALAGKGRETEKVGGGRRGFCQGLPLRDWRGTGPGTGGSGAATLRVCMRDTRLASSIRFQGAECTWRAGKGRRETLNAFPVAPIILPSLASPSFLHQSLHIHQKAPPPSPSSPIPRYGPPPVIKKHSLGAFHQCQGRAAAQRRLIRGRGGLGRTGPY